MLQMSRICIYRFDRLVFQSSYHILTYAIQHTKIFLKHKIKYARVMEDVRTESKNAQDSHDSHFIMYF